LSVRRQRWPKRGAAKWWPVPTVESGDETHAASIARRAIVVSIPIHDFGGIISKWATVLNRILNANNPLFASLTEKGRHSKKCKCYGGQILPMIIFLIGVKIALRNLSLNFGANACSSATQPQLP
jgi:hypothetical protein